MQIVPLVHPRAGPARIGRSVARSFIALRGIDTVYSVAVLVALALVMFLGAVAATAMVLGGLADGTIRGQVDQQGPLGSRVPPSKGGGTGTRR
jgi:hypothetical protein